MADAKHTPGPWFGSREKPVFVPLKAISCERLGFSIGWVNGHREEEAAANARLIAAAPELLEALNAYVEMEEAHHGDMLVAFRPVTDMIRAAITQATGCQQ